MLERPPVALVIDDEPHVGKVLAMMLGRLGRPAISAGSGSKGITLFQQRRESIRCIFMDVRMPGMDGRATLQELRSIEPAIPCFFVTGYSGQYEQDELLAAGAQGVLSKPFSLETLTVALNRLNCPVAQ